MSAAGRLSGDVDPAAYEDDDATMGEPGPVYGMQMPLTDADKTYLDNAISHDDFRARMQTIALRLDAARKRINKANGRNSPDEYMESLRRAPPDLSEEDFRSTGSTPADDYMDSLKNRGPRPDLSEQDFRSTGSSPAEDYMNSLKKQRQQPQLDDADYDARGTNEGEEYMRQLSRGRISSAQTSKPKTPTGGPKPVDDSTKRVQDLQTHLRSQAGADATNLPPDATPDPDVLDAQIAALQEQLRAAAGETGVGSEAMSTQSADPGSLDAQIAAMEAELTAAQEDGEVQQGRMRERLGGAMDDLARGAGGDSQFKGLGNAPGELSEQEKMDAFEAIRRQAMMRQQQMEGEFADPLAKPLPSRKAPGSREDDMGSVDVNVTDSGLTDSYFAVSELEAEVKKYLFDAKQLLNDHEMRMKALLGKLREL